jgi:hypothetical protein
MYSVAMTSGYGGTLQANLPWLFPQRQLQPPADAISFMMRLHAMNLENE